jgi:hypothetical protein
LIRKKAPKLPVGWAAKLINVYLKTRVYLAGDGCPELVDRIHPPIDGFLWRGIKARFENIPGITDQTHVVSTIKGIRTYDTYRTIIGGCEQIASELGCRLIEVDQLWKGQRSSREA